ncbi:MAG: DOPA 4,5-dioxygenase family protein, partial [Pseudomonadota bacterium]
MPEISGYHAHVYFDADSKDRASALCDEAGRLFPVTVGRVHQRNVGPHPHWSCQLAFAPQTFALVVPWLMLNRHGLTVLVHPETGDHLADHRDHAMWLGDSRPLDLSIFG